MPKKSNITSTASRRDATVAALRKAAQQKAAQQKVTPLTAATVAATREAIAERRLAESNELRPGSPVHSRLRGGDSTLSSTSAPSVSSSISLLSVSSLASQNSEISSERQSSDSNAFDGSWSLIGRESGESYSSLEETPPRSIVAQTQLEAPRKHQSALPVIPVTPVISSIAEGEISEQLDPVDTEYVKRVQLDAFDARYMKQVIIFWHGYVKQTKCTRDFFKKHSNMLIQTVNRSFLRRAFFRYKSTIDNRLIERLDCFLAASQMTERDAIRNSEFFMRLTDKPNCVSSVPSTPSPFSAFSTPSSGFSTPTREGLPSVHLVSQFERAELQTLRITVGSLQALVAAGQEYISIRSDFGTLVM